MSQALFQPGGWSWAGGAATGRQARSSRQDGAAASAMAGGAMDWQASLRQATQAEPGRQDRTASSQQRSSEARGTSADRRKADAAGDASDDTAHQAGEVESPASAEVAPPDNTSPSQTQDAQAVAQSAGTSQTVSQPLMGGQGQGAADLADVEHTPTVAERHLMATAGGQQGAMAGQQGDQAGGDAMGQGLAGQAATGSAQAAAGQGGGAMPVDGLAMSAGASGVSGVAAGAGGQAGPVALDGLSPTATASLLSHDANDEAPDMDPNVARVAQGLRGALHWRNGSVTIRLNPAELGTVRIEMQVQQGVVKAAIQSEVASVRDLLGHQLGRLHEALAGRGLVVEKLEVTAPTPADGAGSQQQAQESPDQGRSRGQFFSQSGQGRGGDGRQGQDAPGRERQVSFGQMVVDMMG